jgi:hypothetical protein
LDGISSLANKFETPEVKEARSKKEGAELKEFLREEPTITRTDFLSK